MENPEEVLHSLDEFAKLKPKDIPNELEEYLLHVASTGDPVYQWSLVKSLFRQKLINVITDFYEANPIMDIPLSPNVDPFNYEAMKTGLLERFDTFANAPFTIQRVSELLTTPRKQYNRVDKFMRAVEKNIWVVSTREPGLRETVTLAETTATLVNGVTPPPLTAARCKKGKSIEERIKSGHPQLIDDDDEDDEEFDDHIEPSESAEITNHKTEIPTTTSVRDLIDKYETETASIYLQNNDKPGDDSSANEEEEEEGERQEELTKQQVSSTTVIEAASAVSSESSEEQTSEVDSDPTTETNEPPTEIPVLDKNSTGVNDIETSVTESEPSVIVSENIEPILEKLQEKSEDDSYLNVNKLEDEVAEADSTSTKVELNEEDDNRKGEQTQLEPSKILTVEKEQQSVENKVECEEAETSSSEQSQSTIIIETQLEKVETEFTEVETNEKKEFEARMEDENGEDKLVEMIVEEAENSEMEVDDAAVEPMLQEEEGAEPMDDSDPSQS